VLAERCKVFTGDFYQPLRGMVKAGDQVEERSFAGPAFAVQRYQFSRCDVKACPAQSSSAAPIVTIIFPNISNPDYWGHAASACRVILLLFTFKGL
jgi:hypothetical protein